MPLEEEDSIPGTKDHPTHERPIPSMNADVHPPLHDVEHLVPVSPLLIHCDGRGMNMGWATLPLLFNHHRHLKRQRLIGEGDCPPLIEISPDDDGKKSPVSLDILNRPHYEALPKTLIYHL